MKIKSKIIVLILALAMLFSMIGIFAISSSAASITAGKTLFLKPNDNWKKDGARFAAYFFGNGEAWVSMTDSDGDGIYECTSPSGKAYPSVIFVRMNGSSSANNWGNKWNQTADLTGPSGINNCYAVNEGTWDSGGGTWSHKHIMNSGVVTTEPTCSATGIKTFSCTVSGCTHKTTETIAALGHNFVNNACTRCDATSKTVYAYNYHKWSAMYCYCWGVDENGNTVVDYYKAWPGEKMKDLGNDLWSYEIPSDCNRIIFNNGNTEQTVDLVCPGENKVYDTKSTTDYWSDYVPGKYGLTGNFMNMTWATEYVEPEDGIVTWNIALRNGDFEFKITREGYVWYGNNSSTPMQDTTEATSNVGWVMDRDADNCHFSAKGGSYVFTFNTTTNSITVHRHVYENGVCSGCSDKIDSALELQGAINQAVFDAESDDTIQLQADMSFSNIIESDKYFVNSATGWVGQTHHLYIPEGGNVILDLNGHVISSAANESCNILLVTNGATLTLTDTAETKGSITANAVGGSVIRNFGGVVTLDGGVVVDSNNYTHYSVYTTNVLNSEETSESGQLIVNNAVVHSGFGCLQIVGGSSVTVNEGSFIMDADSNNPSANQQNIVYVAAGTVLTINGGRFESDVSMKGAAVCAESASTVVINDGYFEGPSMSVQSRANSVITLKGGTYVNAFSYGGDTGPGAIENLLVDGASIVSRTAGMSLYSRSGGSSTIYYVGVNAIADAVADAANGDIIKLETDITIDEDVVFPAGKSLVLDLDGHTLASSGDAKLVIKGTVEISDSADGDISNLTAKVDYTDGVIVGVVAAIGDKLYSDLQTAFDEADEEDVVVLMSDIELSQVVLVKNGYKITLDLNGKTVTPVDGWVITNEQQSLIGISRGGYLTINDTVGTGCLDGSALRIAINLTNYGESATGDCASLVINGGKLLGGWYAIAGNGSRDNTYIEINGGHLIGVDWDGIYHPQEGVLLINGGTIEGYDAVYIKADSVLINGGTFIGRSDAAIYIINNGADSGYGEITDVVIRGGNFIAADGYDAVVSLNEGGIAALDRFIYGGTFNADFDPALLAEGYMLADGAEGYEVVKAKAKIGETLYASLADAVAAAQDGDTVKLLEAAELTDMITVDAGKNITLDLSGYALTSGAQDSGITVKGGLKFTDSSAEQSSKVNADISVDGGSVSGLVASIDEDVYLSLQTAFDEADEADVVVLISDFELPGVVLVKNGYKITLDLNGKTVTPVGSWVITNEQQSLIGVCRGGHLTINNSVGTGCLDGSALKVAINLTNYGESATGDCASLVINGGKFIGNLFGIAGNGGRDNTYLEINGGQIIGNEWEAIYHPQDGDLKITGGVFISKTYGAVTIYSGKFDISGGEFYATSGPALLIENIGGTGYQAIRGGSISGGRFYGVDDDAIASYDSGAGQLVGFVSGGQYNTTIENVLVINNKTLGYNDGTGLYEVVDAPITVDGVGYASAEDAANAAGSGDVVIIYDPALLSDNAGMSKLLNRCSTVLISSEHEGAMDERGYLYSDPNGEGMVTILGKLDYYIKDGNWWLGGVDTGIKATGSNGTDGAGGKTAYELARENGYTGTEAEWLAALVGAPGSVGDKGPTGSDGLTAYEIAKKNGYTGTEDEWLESLIGVPGVRGESGKTLFELAQENGFTGTEDEWLSSLVGAPGAPGKSAYELAVAEGYEGTLAEWMIFITGKKGDTGSDGMTAYEIAKKNGYTGTEAEWLAALAGEKGDTGSDGLTAYEIAKKNGYTGTEAEWLESLVGAQGNGGFSAYELAQKNGYTGTKAEWLESLVGVQGNSGASAYELAVKNGYEGTEDEWRSSLAGKVGTNGKSAYELAVEAGFDGTEAEWLHSLIGKDGVDGVDGDSAYELAVKNGYEGTFAEWLVSLKGADGKDGTDAVNGKSAYELAKENGYEGTLQEWLASLVAKDGMNGTNGKTAYELAVEKGYKGTLEEWIASLAGQKGDKGDKGDQGEPGKPGADGNTPYVGDNGNWWVGDTDLGVPARGENGEDGEVPHIGENGNWWIGDTDLGILAHGQDANVKTTVIAIAIATLCIIVALVALFGGRRRRSWWYF